MNVKVRGETKSSPTQLFLAAGESDQATYGHVLLDNIRDRLHGLSADVPIMVCEDVNATGKTAVLLDRDVNGLSQQHFTAGSELIVWPGECQVTGHPGCRQFFCVVSSAVVFSSPMCNP